MDNRVFKTIAGLAGLASLATPLMPGAAALIIPAISGAMGVAQGIKEKSPGKILSGAVQGASGGLASPAVSPSIADAANVTENAGAFGNAANLASQAAKGITGTASKNVLGNIGAGLQAASAATSGVMGLINSFKNQGRIGGYRMGLDQNLPYLNPVGGMSPSQLPNIPNTKEFTVSNAPNVNYLDPRQDKLLLQLLGAYTT